jgi:hypothetical protein
VKLLFVQIIFAAVSFRADCIHELLGSHAQATRDGIANTFMFGGLNAELRKAPLHRCARLFLLGFQHFTPKAAHSFQRPESCLQNPAHMRRSGAVSTWGCSTNRTTMTSVALSSSSFDG